MQAMLSDDLARIEDALKSVYRLDAGRNGRRNWSSMQRRVLRRLSLPKSRGSPDCPSSTAPEQIHDAGRP